MSRQRALPYVFGAMIGACAALVLLILMLIRGGDLPSWTPFDSDGAVDLYPALGSSTPVGTGSAAEAFQDSISAGRSNALVTATRLASPAVVSITVIYHQFVRVAANPLDALKPGRGGVRRLPFEILGSGVIVDPRGYIVTNDHVLGSHQDSESRIFVTLADGRQYEAEDVGRARSHDLALLRFTEPVPDMPVASLGDSDMLQPGEWAIAIGAPYRELLDDPSLTVTVGVISALHRDLKEFNQTQGDRNYLGMIQTDAAIHQGNSGGALVNARGEVIGINAFIIAGSDGGAFGASFAVPINRVRWVLNEILEFGEMRPRYHGFDGIVIDGYARRVLEMSPDIHGVLVTRVDPGSPAAVAGLREGDIIHAIGGQSLLRKRDYYRVLYESPLGSRLVLVVARDGEVHELELTLAEGGNRGGDAGR